jgi:broad specificity phosphatase PhoE
MLIKLVRHARSHLNAGLVKHNDMPNNKIPIVEPDGIVQANDVGRTLGKGFLEEALLYQSPYLRTRQTMRHLLIGAGFPENSLPKVYEDPRLREVDFGYGDPETQKGKRETEGYFWYRFDGGESSADCFDRSATFLDSMMRQLGRKPMPIINSCGNLDMENRNVVIVSHGLIIRCLVMKFMHMTVEEFDSTDTPGNCSIVTIGPKEQITKPQFVSGKWAVEGLRMRGN